MLYAAIVYLWSLNFIFALHKMFIAGVVSDWYFAYMGKKLRSCSSFRAIGRVLCYNLGSAILGSFLIPLLYIPRSCLLLWHSLARRGPHPKLFTSCGSCLAIFQRFLEYLDNTAYVTMAIYGYNLVKAGKVGTAIFRTSSTKVGPVLCVHALVLLLSKLSIVWISITGLVLYLDEMDVTRFWILSFMITLISCFYMVSIFTDMYEVGAQTLVHCFIEDVERNSPDDRHHSIGLESFMSDPARKKEKMCCCC